jgi:hypothetical protein
MWLGPRAQFWLRTWNQTFFFYFCAGKFWSAAPTIAMVLPSQHQNHLEAGRWQAFLSSGHHPKENIEGYKKLINAFVFQLKRPTFDKYSFLMKS